MSRRNAVLVSVLTLAGCDQLFKLQHVDNPPDAPVDTTRMADVPGCVVKSTDYSVGANPYSVTIADVDGRDGPDIIVPGTGAANVTVLLNQGDGTFMPSQTIATGNTPTHVVVYDMDGDGTLDLVTMINGTGNVRIDRGAGDGTFTFEQSVSAGGGLAVGVGNINADGLPDLVVAQKTANQLQVIIQSAPGSYTFLSPVATVATPQDLALADVNGDTKIDVVTVGQSTSQLEVLLGDGLGGFSSKTQVTVGTSPDVISLGDVDGDGFIDYAVGSAAGQRVDVLLNDGSGKTKSPQQLPVLGQVWGMALGDINADSKLDVVAAQYDGAQGIRAFLGNGAGVFGAAMDYAGHGAGEAVAIANFDAMPPNDIVVANWDRATVTVTLGCPP